MDIDPMAFEALRLSANRQAPPDERSHATLEAARSLASQAPIISKADMFQAVMYQERLRQRQQAGRPRSAMSDPFAVWRNDPHTGIRPAPLGFEQLRQMVGGDAILSSIVLTRARQISRLAKPSRSDREPGFRVRVRGMDELEQKQSKAVQQRLEWVERYIMAAGAEFNFFERERMRRDNFMSWLKMSAIDSLTMDAMPVEIIRTRKGRIHGWAHVDGATVFPAPHEGLPEGTPEPVDLDPEHPLPDREDVKAVRVVNSQVLDWYAYGDLLYPIRNPRPDLFGQGYGLAEPELILRFVTGFLNVISFNLKSYEENHIPPGFITLFGNFTREDVEAFKAEWQAYVAGISNAWRLPIMISEDKESGATYTQTGVSPNEMTHAKWISFLVAVHCAPYGIAPEEIGFEGFSTKTSSLSDASIESKLTSGNDKGLFPLLQHYEDVMNIILQDLDPDLEFAWTGFKDPKEGAEWDKLVLTFGEARQNQGLPPTGNELLDNAPINPTLVSVYLQAAGQQMQGFGGENLEQPPQGEGFPPEADAEQEPDEEAEDEEEQGQGANGQSALAALMAQMRQGAPQQRSTAMQELAKRMGKG